jgi:hypothetical protein
MESQINSATAATGLTLPCDTTYCAVSKELFQTVASSLIYSADRKFSIVSTAGAVKSELCEQHAV